MSFWHHPPHICGPRFAAPAGLVVKELEFGHGNWMAMNFFHHYIYNYIYLFIYIYIYINMYVYVWICINISIVTKASQNWLYIYNQSLSGPFAVYKLKMTLAQIRRGAIFPFAKERPQTGQLSWLGPPFHLQTSVFEPCFSLLHAHKWWNVPIFLGKTAWCMCVYIYIHS